MYRYYSSVYIPNIIVLPEAEVGGEGGEHHDQEQLSGQGKPEQNHSFFFF